MGPVGYILTGLVLLGGAALGARYYQKHHHVEGCPTYAQVQKAVADVDGNVVSLDSARATANAWERQGCQPAADALRAVITLRAQKEETLRKAAELGGKLVPPVVNWIPGCVAPAGFVPPASWMPGSPGAAIPATASSAGWMPPDGWKVGDGLPDGYPCPPGWTKAPGASSGTSSTASESLGLTKGYRTGAHAKLHRRLGR